jgi:hypothetical protein
MATMFYRLVRPSLLSVLPSRGGTGTRFTTAGSSPP